MRSTKGIGCLVAVGLIGLGASAASADAKWYDAIALSGYTQASYVANLNDPRNSSGQKQSNTGRQFDTESNGFSFNTFLLQIAKPVGDDHVGFTVRLRTGQDAGVLSGTSSTQFFVQEGYVTYAATSKLSLIGGKFVTPEGYEVVDTVANPNFSEGLLFTYAEPITHTGVKANYTFSDKVNATLGLVNGWDVAPDNNTGKTILWQVVATPIKPFAWYFQGLYGKELADPTHSQRLSLDSVATYTMGKLSLAGQVNWGQQTNDTNVPTNGGTAAGVSHWSGAGVWASFAETDKCTSTVRFEVLKDENFANRFSLASTFPRTGTTNQTVKEITFTQKHMFTSSFGTRVEFRHDWSNQAYFQKHDGSNVRNQNTISSDWFVTF